MNMCPESRVVRQCGKRLRCRLSVARPVRWVSHLEFMGMLTRAVRRTAAPVQYSRGFNPRPQMSFATARPVGLSSEAEFVDFTMQRPYCPDEFGEALDGSMPKGFSVSGCKAVSEDGPSLMAALNAARYELLYEGRVPQLSEWQAALCEFLQRSSIVITRERHNKPDRRLDIRPNIYRLRVSSESCGIRVLADLGLGGENNVRPSELVSALQAVVQECLQATQEVRRPAVHRLEVYRREDNQKISAWCV